MIEGQEIYRLLGGARVFPKPLRSTLEWDDLIRGASIPWAAVDHFKKTLNASNPIMAEILGVGLRTLSSRHKPNTALNKTVADRLYRSALVYVQAEEVFGSVEAAREWLTTPQHGLGHRVPLELLATEAGTREVRDLLGRIEYGLLA